MKISLITITWNNLKGLRHTVESVLRQTYADVEFIVVDGFSNDGSQEYLAQYRDKIKVIESAPKGVYNALNVGIKAATGDVVGLLNGGDVFTSDDILQIVADKFNGDASLDFLYGDIHYVNYKGHESRYYSGEDCSMLTIRRGFAPPHPSLIMKRSLFDTVGLYDEDFKLAGDFEMFLRLFSNSKIKHVYLPLDMVTMAPGGISSRWRNRLYTNNVERLRAMRKNRLKSSWFRVLLHYYYILKDLLCRKRKSR